MEKKGKEKKRQEKERKRKERNGKERKERKISGIKRKAVSQGKKISKVRGRKKKLIKISLNEKNRSERTSGNRL